MGHILFQGGDQIPVAAGGNPQAQAGDAVGFGDALHHRQVGILVQNVLVQDGAGLPVREKGCASPPSITGSEAKSMKDSSTISRIFRSFAQEIRRRMSARGI